MSACANLPAQQAITRESDSLNSRDGPTAPESIIIHMDRQRPCANLQPGPPDRSPQDRRIL